MRILSIGNSFSQDAHRYLHRLAKKEGVDLTTVNLYIGGCSIKRHYNNIVNDLSEYVYSENTGDGWKKTENFSIAKFAYSSCEIVSIERICVL